MKTYEFYNEITKELLDSIKVGDLIKINDWKKPMRVVAVSVNYFVMIQKQFKDTIYSVCEKKKLQPEAYRHNNMIGGKFHCSTDNMIFGYMPKDWNFEDKQYDFENPKWNIEYLQAFENEKIKLSERHGISIDTIQIKRNTNM